MEKEDRSSIERLADGFMTEIEASDNYRTDDFYLYRFNNITMIWDRYKKKTALPALLQDYLPVDRNASEFKYSPAKRKEIIAVCNEILDVLFTDPVFRLPACTLEDYLLPLIGGKCLDLRTLELTDFGKKDFVTWAADFSFIEKAGWKQVPEFRKYLKLSLGIDLDSKLPTDKERKLALLCQILTYMISNLNGAKKAFILLGPANCGKSRLLNFVKRFVGDDNYSPLRFSDLGQRFRSSMLLHTNYILNDELGRSIENLDILKKVLSGEEIVAEEKNKPSFVLRPNIKAMFASNVMPLPVELDHGGALLQRLQVLKFGETIPREHWVLDLDDRLWQERDAIMSLAIIKGRDIVSNNYQFTDDPETKAIIENYSIMTNSVAAFINDATCVIRSDGAAVYSKELYNRYKQFCDDAGIRAVPDDIFSGQLMEYGFSKKRARLYGDKNPRACVVGLKLVQRF